MEASIDLLTLQLYPQKLFNLKVSWVPHEAEDVIQLQPVQQSPCHHLLTQAYILTAGN